MRIGLRRAVDAVLPGESLTLSERDTAFRGSYFFLPFGRASYAQYGDDGAGYVQIERVPWVGTDMVVTGEYDPDIPFSQDPAFFPDAQARTHSINQPWTTERIHQVEAVARVVKVAMLAATVGAAMLIGHDS